MLHVLQYFIGTSIAAVDGLDDLTKTQSFIGGSRVRGSSVLSGGGIGWRFRGRIWMTPSQLYTRDVTRRTLTPGSVTDAWKKEDIQMKKIYAKRMGIAGETLCHSHGALIKKDYQRLCPNYLT